MAQSKSPAATPPSSSSRRPWQFILLFGGAFGLLVWLLDGAGPVAWFNRGIHQFTLFQASTAASMLRVLGESVTAHGAVIGGAAFSCEVDTGCNGMTAVALLAAGLLSFPTSWRARALGLLVLLPAVVAVNLVRIALLYWVGAHFPAHFGTVHVYVGQVLVITATAGLWWIWLTWSSQRPVASS